MLPNIGFIFLHLIFVFQLSLMCVQRAELAVAGLIEFPSSIWFWCFFLGFELAFVFGWSNLIVFQRWRLADFKCAQVISYFSLLPTKVDQIFGLPLWINCSVQAKRVAFAHDLHFVCFEVFFCVHFRFVLANQLFEILFQLVQIIFLLGYRRRFRPFDGFVYVFLPILNSIYLNVIQVGIQGFRLIFKYFVDFRV